MAPENGSTGWSARQEMAPRAGGARHLISLIDEALYRRGVARSELLQFGEAKADLLQACKLEPRSREIREQFDRTKAAHAEAKACNHLQRQGFAVYYPKFLRRRSHARKVDWIPSPLFPRYLFVQIDFEKSRWLSIYSTIGVANLICFGDRPQSLPGEIVAELRAPLAQPLVRAGFVVLVLSKYVNEVVVQETHLRLAR